MNLESLPQKINLSNQVQDNIPVQTNKNMKPSQLESIRKPISDQIMLSLVLLPSFPRGNIRPHCPWWHFVPSDREEYLQKVIHSTGELVAVNCTALRCAALNSTLHSKVDGVDNRPSTDQVLHCFFQTTIREYPQLDIISPIGRNISNWGYLQLGIMYPIGDQGYLTQVIQSQRKNTQSQIG